MDRQTFSLVPLLALIFFSPSGAFGDQVQLDKLSEYDSPSTKGQMALAESEGIVKRGSTANETTVPLVVFVPTSATIVSVRVFMKNEPWGGLQHPPKPDTDDMKTTDYFECPQGTDECPIGWSRVSTVTKTSLVNGMTQYRARFTNWVGRNDRTGKLQVTYRP